MAKTIDKATRKAQTTRFNILIDYLKENNYFNTQIELSEMVGIDKTYLSSVITGKYTPIGTTIKICEHFKLPFSTWVETGEGTSPVIMFNNGTKYIGFLDENESVREKMTKPFTPVSLPDNLTCECVFIYRGKMLFVNKFQKEKKFIDAGAKYYIEMEDGTKLIKRITEIYTKDTRILTFTEPDNSIPQFDIPISKIKDVYRVIATLEFTR